MIDILGLSRSLETASSLTIRLKQENFFCNTKTNYTRHKFLIITHKNNCCQVFSRSSNNQLLFVNEYKFKVGKFKRFKKVSSDLKTILKTDLANLRFLSFEKGVAYQSILIMLRGKIGLRKPEVKKIGCTWSFLSLEEFKIYLSWNISQLI